MTITKEEMYETRFNLAHQMHDYIMNLGDEEAYETWITYAIPDEPDEEDFEYYAENKLQFKSLCLIFGDLVAKYR